MSFFDRFKGRGNNTGESIKGGLSDELGGNLGGNFPDELGKNSGLGLPSLGEEENKTQNPFTTGQDFPTENQYLTQQHNESFTNQNPNMLNLDHNNPDLNEQLGMPKPNDPAERDITQMQTTNSNMINHGQQLQGLGNVNQQIPSNQQSSTMEKDLQIIMAKLDAIKSELDSLSQRVQKIEKIADADQAAATNKNNPQYGRW